MILVTGASGFLGAELVLQLLQAENKVRCIKRATSKIPPKLEAYQHKIEWLNADVLELSALEDAFEGIHKVYHCAAQVSLNPKDNVKMIRTNTQGTANVVNLSIEKGIEKLIHVSSIVALGKSKDGEPITEENYWDAFDINHGYSISKYQSEMEVWRGMEEGLNAVIVNPSVIIGADAGQEGTRSIFSTVKNGLKYYTGGGTGFVDVYDVARCMIFLGNSDIKNERFIINTENLSYKNLFETIAAAFKIAPPSKLAKPWMLEIAWRLSELKSFLTGSKSSITKDMVQMGSHLDIYSAQKIKGVVDFEFRPIAQSIKQITETF